MIHKGRRHLSQSGPGSVAGVAISAALKARWWAAGKPPDRAR
jgi:hypothetical protein